MASLMKDEDTAEDVLEGETLGLPEDDDDEAEVIENEDGSAIVRLKNEEQVQDNRAHFANIADDVEPGLLRKIATELVEKIERDKEAREKRDKQYEEGLRRTGLGDDAPGGAQFTGATRVVHPMLVEACVDFSARVMKELFPPTGPVKSKIVGLQDKEKVEKAQRKSEFMNLQATEQMTELRGELEQLTTQVPLGGGQYLKLSWSEDRHRPAAEFVPIDDVLIPFAATNFANAERKTHVQYITESEYQRRVRSGMYRDVDLPSTQTPERSKTSQANDKIEGRKETTYNEDGLRKVYEVQTRLDLGLPGDKGPEPYIITIDEATDDVLALYRNWEPEDQYKCELEWMVEFPFVPWRGAYPIGLTHMIGSLSGAATGALRALLDSAHIQNIPTLLKLKGGPNGQTISLQPTEVAELEGGALIDDIRKLVMPMPFNGPSPVLFQLLGFLTEAGRGVIQTSFEKLADQNPNAPVGTTLALIEQGMVVFSSIHSRLHASMTKVFKILHRINSAYLTQEVIDELAPDCGVRPEDFDGPMDVIPVSDPAIFSETQRFAQVQAIMQRSALLPQMYDGRKVEEMFLRALKVPDDILQPKPGQDDVDPVSENVAATLSRPIYVLPKQDHLAHLKLHMAFLQSPLFGQNPAIIKTYLFPMASHLRDHLLNYYLTETHRAVQQATEQELIQDEAEQQAQVIIRVQQMIEQQLGAQFGQMLAQIDQQAQQFKPQPPMPPDNSMQVAQLNAQQKAQDRAARQQSEQQRLTVQQQSEAATLQDRERERQARLAQEQLAQQQESVRKTQDIASRERMNTADNTTAMTIAAAEIESGERVGVSTGTGINPG